MKKKILAAMSIVAVVLLIIIFANALSEKKGGQAYFNGQVLEITEKSVLVEPVGDFWETCYQSIWVNLETVSPNSPEFEVGDILRIVYNGQIQESSPAQINHAFSIYLVDESGNVIIH